MKHLLMFFFAASAALCMAAPALPVKCVSHRGEEFDAPEASRPAFVLAARRKADIVKLDIRFTKDGVVVLSHDATLKRTMDWDVPVDGHTFRELREGGVFREVGGCKGERLLTLREALDIVRDCPEFWIDTKAFTEEGVERAGIGHDRIMLATFNREALRYARKKHPEIRRVLHVYVRKMPEGNFHSFPTEQDFKTREELTAELLKWRDEFALHGFNINKGGFTSGALTEAELRKFHAKKLWCSIWFVNSVEDAKFFNRIGADAFVTGRIETVRPHCGRSAAEAGK